MCVCKEYSVFLLFVVTSPIELYLYLHQYIFTLEESSIMYYRKRKMDFNKSSSSIHILMKIDVWSSPFLATLSQTK